MSPEPQDTPETPVSQTVRAQLRLRDLVLGGELSPGERISEPAVAARLGMSRTPIRMALVRLEEEGLLEAIPSGGFAVKAFQERDVRDAIEIRGTLEGLAARLAAERGLSAAALAEIKECLAEIDRLLEDPELTVDSFSAYVRLNGKFHDQLIALSGSPVLARQIERVVRLPFAAPEGFVMIQAMTPEARFILTMAQDQHRLVVDAIENREGARAEALMREHARVAYRNLQIALRSQKILAEIPGGKLIRRAGYAV